MSAPAAPLRWRSTPVAMPLAGEIEVPGDKSISHRAIMLAALAEGSSQVDGFLEGEDTRATAAIFGQLGVRIDTPSASRRIVHGVGLHGLRAPLQRRPMRRVIEPLARMGARIEAAAGDLPPLRVRGGATLQGIDYALPVASAQVKSALLLAGLYARGETCVREPHPTRDYSERMLAAFGWPIRFAPGRAQLTGGHRLRGCAVQVPADFSSAAFFIVAASLVPGSRLLLRAVGLNARRTGLLTALRLMGADIREHAPREQGGERVADLEVRHAPLHGIDVPVELVPDMIDEFPILFVAAAAARGTTRIRGAAELRVKESDRIALMAQGLARLGVDVAECADGATIEGGRIGGGSVASATDHRIAMSFAVAGLVAAAAVEIDDCTHVATSFPGFLALANSAGFALQQAPAPDAD